MALCLFFWRICRLWSAFARPARLVLIGLFHRLSEWNKRWNRWNVKTRDKIQAGNIFWNWYDTRTVLFIIFGRNRMLIFVNCVLSATSYVFLQSRLVFLTKGLISWHKSALRNWKAKDLRSKFYCKILKRKLGTSKDYATFQNFKEVDVHSFEKRLSFCLVFRLFWFVTRGQIFFNQIR